jgi:hypothetical protein
VASGQLRKPASGRVSVDCAQPIRAAIEVVRVECGG